MPEPSLAAQTAELKLVWEDIIRMQPRLRELLPADLSRAREHLRGVSPESAAKPFADYQLFIYYRIGLVFSRHKEPLTMREFSEALNVPLSTATRMVDWLVDSGYVQRLPDPQDRRVVRVALTGNGAKLYTAFNEFINQHVEEVLRRFTPQERKDLIVLLRKVVQALGELSR